MANFRITQDIINSLIIRGADEDLLNSCRRWIQRVPELDPLIQEIHDAFEGIALDDGIGLLEANGLDDYASDKELAELRSKDERTDWEKIEIQQLNYCYVSPDYMDARGYYFHLPAFLIADLQDQFNMAFVDDYLVHSLQQPRDWVDLLTTAQRLVIEKTLRLVSEYPDFADQPERIAIAIQHLRNPQRPETIEN